MRVTTLRIENFRGIKRLDLDELTVLIGKNNSGKIAAFDAPWVPGCSRRAMVCRKGT